MSLLAQWERSLHILWCIAKNLYMPFLRGVTSCPLAHWEDCYICVKVLISLWWSFTNTNEKAERWLSNANEKAASGEISKHVWSFMRNKWQEWQEWHCFHPFSWVRDALKPPNRCWRQTPPWCPDNHLLLAPIILHFCYLKVLKILKLPILRYSALVLVWCRPKGSEETEGRYFIEH